MKVKIQQRSVYHKYAEIEIIIDKDDYEDYLISNKNPNLQEYLLFRDLMYSDKMDEALYIAPCEYGFGTDSDANSHNKSEMSERDQESEWRYECEELNIGGHL